MERKNQIIQLWRCCFEDSEDFIHRFFSQVYQDQNAWTLEKDGRIVCAMQLLPYTINYYGQSIPATYIYGVCTHPDYRRRGYMHQLLEQAFVRLKEQGSGLAFLIPAHDWLFDCYRKSGFTEAFGCRHATQTYPVIPPYPLAGVEELTVSDLYAGWRYLDRKWREEPVSILHSWEDFQFLYQDVIASDGKCFLYRQGDEIQGVLMAVPSGEKLFLPEWKADTESVRDALFQAAAAVFQRQEIDYRLPGKTARYGMARILSPERFLSRWKEMHPDKPLTDEAWQAWSVREQTTCLLDKPESSGYMRLMMD